MSGYETDAPPVVTAAAKAQTSSMSVRDGVQMLRSQYLAGFRQDAQRTYPTVPIPSPRFDFAVDGSLGDLEAKFPEMVPVFYNDVKVCSACGKRCSYILAKCDQCETSMASVPVSKAENVFSAMLLGVRNAGKGFPYKISLRRETEDVLVFDSAGSITTCNMVAVSKKYYIPDWRFLLMNPEEGLALISTLETECWNAMQPFLRNAEYRRVMFKDDALSDDDIKKHIIRSFNFPASQNLMHMQWIVPPLAPYQHYKLERRNHLQEDRSFPVDYVRELLKLNEKYPVNMETPFEDITRHFDARVNYKYHWAKFFEGAVQSSLDLQNWSTEDFDYVVQDDHVYEFTVQDGKVCKGSEVCGITPEQLQAKDKVALQNYGRPYTEEGKPNGTYAQWPLQVKMGEGGFGHWPGVTLPTDRATKRFELRILFVRHAKSYYRKILAEMEPQLSDLHAEHLRVDVPLHPSQFEEAANKLEKVRKFMTTQSPPPLQLGSAALRLQQSQVLAVPGMGGPESNTWLRKVKACHCLRVDTNFSPAPEEERIDYGKDSVTLKEKGEHYVRTILGAITIGTRYADVDSNPSKALENEHRKFPAFISFLLDSLDKAGDERPVGDIDAVVMVHNFWLVSLVKWLDSQGAISDVARNVLLPLIPERLRAGLPVQKNGIPKYCSPALCGCRCLKITGSRAADGTLSDLQLDDQIGDLQDDGSIKIFEKLPQTPAEYANWIDKGIETGYLLVGV